MTVKSCIALPPAERRSSLGIVSCLARVRGHRRRPGRWKYGPSPARKTHHLPTCLRPVLEWHIHPRLRR